MGRLLLLVTACLCLAAPSWVSAETHEVQVGNFFFSPQNLTIQKGDTVRWVWVSGTHTTTSGSPDDLENSGLVWDNPLNEGTPSFEHTFNDAGAFPYYCTIHPAMLASITVEEGTPIRRTTWTKIKRLFEGSTPGRLQ